MPLRSGVFEHPAFVGSTKHSDSPSASAIETPAWCVDDRSLKERSGPLPERRRRLRDHPYVGVLRNPHLRRLYLGIFVSSIGDGVAAVTVPWLALEVAGTVNRAFAVAAAATLAFLPGIPLSLVAGLRRWRIPPRTMLVVDSVFRGALFTLMGVLAVTDHLALGPYLIILAVSSLTRTLVAGARRTAIDQLIRPEQRLAANSLLGTCFQLGQDVLGPAAGGLRIAGPGPGVALLVDAASFAVLGALAIALPAAARAERAEAQGPRLSVLRSVPRFVLWLIGVTFVFNFLYGPIDVGLPIFVRHSLGEGSTLYGQMFTVFGVGSLIGSLAVGGLRRESMVQWILVLSIIGWGGRPAPRRGAHARHGPPRLRAGRPTVRAQHRRGGQRDSGGHTGGRTDPGHVDLGRRRHRGAAAGDGGRRPARRRAGNTGDVRAVRRPDAGTGDGHSGRSPDTSAQGDEQWEVTRGLATVRAQDPE